MHAERTRLADLLEGLTPEQWAERTLCPRWSVEDVTAHLTAIARTGTAAWLWSMARARFDGDAHNARLLRKYSGRGHGETLETYRRSIPLTISPTRDLAAILGEAVVHGQDIARALGLELTPEPDAVVEVARFFAAKDFAVKSKTLINGLRLEATDAAFTAGSGPVVQGAALDLAMTMAGRREAARALSGDGVGELRRRLG
ncbi:MAG: maleylpyruvate isomerase family mycothiol-dependent enzyme [Arachnia sp.]